MYMYNEKYANDYGINGTTKSVSTVRIKEVKTQIWTTRIKKKSLMQILKNPIKNIYKQSYDRFSKLFPVLLQLHQLSWEAISRSQTITVKCQYRNNYDEVE